MTKDERILDVCDRLGVEPPFSGYADIRTWLLDVIEALLKRLEAIERE